MRSSESNPPRNSIPQGMNVDGFIRAIELSGYPLQGVAAAKLLNEFDVTEEWGYIDRDSGEHRTLDVFALKSLVEDISATIQPGLILLIECKRSEHPYVFFRAVTHGQIPEFPRISGLRRNVVSIYERGSNRGVEMAATHFLGLKELPFVESGPPLCSTFSKAQLSGDKVRLSGSEPFNNLILPLVKASDHAANLFATDQRATHLFPRLILNLSVLESPMILIESPSLVRDPILVPWVRVYRQEAVRDRRGEVDYNHYAIDVVHIDFLDEYIANKVLPFAREYAQRAIQMESVLLRGGTVPSLKSWTWEEIEPK